MIDSTVFAKAQANGDQYITRVNRDKLNVERHTDYLNDAYKAGFKLFAIFEQNGNTVMVFERRV